MPSDGVMPNAEAYRAADDALRQGREAWRRAEAAMMAQRDAALRKMIGTDRGGLIRTSHALGVSVAQVLRLLDDGITRATQKAMAQLGLDRSGYRTIRQRGGRKIGLVIDGVPDTDVTRAMEHEGLVLLGCRMMAHGTDAERWNLLKQTKKRVQGALLDAGVSSAAYRLRAARGDREVRLTIVPILAGVVDVIRDQIIGVLCGAGLVVESGPGDHQLLVVPASSDVPERELVFGWGD